MPAPQLLQQSGKYLNIAQNHQLFFGSTLIAGVALPVNAATLASTFTLWNPPGSGKFVELVEFGLGTRVAATVVDAIMAYFSYGVSGQAAGPPTSPTIAAGAVGSGVGTATGGMSTDGAAASVARLYSALTLTNTLVLGPGMVLMGGFGATTNSGIGPNPYNFDGKVYLPPDALVTFTTNVAAETAMVCSLSWIEW